jgi:hypothetical protein
MLMAYANFGKELRQKTQKASQNDSRSKCPFIQYFFKKHEERYPMSHSVNLYLRSDFVTAALTRASLLRSAVTLKPGMT